MARIDAVRICVQNIDYPRASATELSCTSDTKVITRQKVKHGRQDTAANYLNTTSIEECKSIVRNAGFIPAQRSTLYEILKVIKVEEAAQNKFTRI
jgi:2-iminoacetate synthase ThiH